MILNLRQIKNVTKEIEKLPSEYVQIVQLRYFEEFTNKEIAKILDLSVEKISYKLADIEYRLKTLLNTLGIEYNDIEEVVYEIMHVVFERLIQSYALDEETYQKIFNQVYENAYNYGSYEEEVSDNFYFSDSPIRRYRIKLS